MCILTYGFDALRVVFGGAGAASARSFRQVFDEKRYFFCGKGFRKLMFKLLVWYIARLLPASPVRDQGLEARRGQGAKLRGCQA